MADDTSVLESGAQTELPLESSQRSRAKSDSTVLCGLGLTAVDSGDSSFVDADNAVDEGPGVDLTSDFIEAFACDADSLPTTDA